MGSELSPLVGRNLSFLEDSPIVEDPPLGGYDSPSWKTPSGGVRTPPLATLSHDGPRNPEWAPEGGWGGGGFPPGYPRGEQPLILAL